MSDLAAILVDPIDEGLHTPGPNDLWSESYYLDAVNKEGTLGVYVRIGRTVNQNVSVYTAAICEKGKPAIMIVFVNFHLDVIVDFSSEFVLLRPLF